ncbi:Flp family type IVb pilin [Erythrobacter sp. HKB08]|uniref:Flp family type IVb pilin n=1 Tax=Erythrobacter sp. HKB08 TaxID=2502843 RepID=UPI0010090BDC|nr:Flp family type IVb pilin [Erythrobacter sp. HKB08]
MFARLVSDENGATAIEYGLLVALLAIAMIVALQSTGTELATTMTTVDTTLAGSNTV